MDQRGEDQWRVCHLCHMMSRRDSRQWLQACQCPQPFHRQCLQFRVGKCEAQRPPKVPRCPWCGALYRVESTKGLVITSLETIAYCWYPNLRRIMGLIACEILIESVSTTYGLLTLSGVYGSREALVMIFEVHPWSAVLLCCYLSLTAIVINNIPWEDYLLKSLRRCSSLPVLGVMMPKGGPELQPLKSRSKFGSISGGMLLPFFSEVTGRLLFPGEESSSKRFLLGGTVFLLVRGIFYMYYRQKTFLRQHNLSVANYVPPNQEIVSSASDGHL